MKSEHSLRIGDLVELKRFGPPDDPTDRPIRGTVIRLSWAINPETWESRPSVNIHFDKPPISWYNDHEIWPEENVVLLERPWRTPKIVEYSDREWIERQIELVGYWK